METTTTTTTYKNFEVTQSEYQIIEIANFDDGLNLTDSYIHYIRKSIKLISQEDIDILKKYKSVEKLTVTEEQGVIDILRKYKIRSFSELHDSIIHNDIKGLRLTMLRIYKGFTYPQHKMLFLYLKKYCELNNIEYTTDLSFNFDFLDYIEERKDEIIQECEKCLKSYNLHLKHIINIICN